MIISILLLAATADFRFSGGSEQALVDQAAAQLKRPIVMLAVGADSRKPFEFHYDDGKDLRRLMNVKSGFDVTPAGGFFPPAWPAGVGRVWESVFYQRRFESFGSKARFKEGRLTLRTEPKEGATLDDLAKLGFSRPLAWPSFYNRARLRLNVSNVTEREFLTALGDATGTRLIEEKTGYRLVTVPGQYRSRAIGMWRNIGEEGRRFQDWVKVTDAEYMLTLLPLTTNWLITHGIDDPDGNYAQTWKPGTSVHTAAWRRVETMNNTPAVQGVFRHAARPEDSVYGYIRDSGEPRVGYRNTQSHEVIEI